MCLAIVKPASVMVPEAHLREGWRRNPDGAGYAFVHDGELQSRKGFMKLKEFLESYNKDVVAHADSPFLIHFRITSMGSTTEENTHPFKIDDGLLIHNGTLTGTGAVYGNGPSDTARFAEMFKSDLSFDFIAKHKAAWDAAVTGSKLCILYKDARYQIINEKDGRWEDGVWYSNTSYKAWASSPPLCAVPLEWEGD